jgi:hypothetical protein
MDEWTLAQSDDGEELAQLHFFSVKKNEPRGDVVFKITVKEFATMGPDRSMRFFASTDKQTNQNTARFTPCGWGDSLLTALSECLRSIRRFPFEGPDSEIERRRD